MGDIVNRREDGGYLLGVSAGNEALDQHLFAPELKAELEVAGKDTLSRERASLRGGVLENWLTRLPGQRQMLRMRRMRVVTGRQALRWVDAGVKRWRRVSGFMRDVFGGGGARVY